MKNCIFTICAKNYIGLAKVLIKSACKFSNDFDYYIFVADEFNGDYINKDDFVKEVKKLNIIDSNHWYEMAYKYNITEFCTALKPFVFEWIFSHGYDNACYFDPDILFYESVDRVFDELNSNLIIMTPHFSTFPQNEKSKSFEDEVKFSGIYNLGFLGLRNHPKTRQMLAWWSDNLYTKCFSDIPTHQFTDQKWMDFMPVFFDSAEIRIEKDFGWNLAPWNFFERKISHINGKYMVSDRNKASADFTPIFFIHYSGFNYKQLLLDNIIVQNNDGHGNSYDDLYLVFDEYRNNLLNEKELILEYLNMTYSYNFYETGEIISNIHRRLYRSYITVNKIIKNENPFMECSDFYKLLKAKKMMDKSIDSSVKDVRGDKQYIYTKLKKMNKLFNFVYKVIGIRRYTVLLRFLHKYSIYENQLFLIDTNIIKWD